MVEVRVRVTHRRGTHAYHECLDRTRSAQATHECEQRCPRQEPLWSAVLCSHHMLLSRLCWWEGAMGREHGSTALSQHTLRSVANRGNFSLIVLMMAAWGSAMSEPLSDIPHAASGVSVSSPACCYITVVCTIKVYIMVENKRGGGEIDV